MKKGIKYDDEELEIHDCRLDGLPRYACSDGSSKRPQAKSAQ